MDNRTREIFAVSKEWKWLKGELQDEMSHKINQLASGKVADITEYRGIVASIKVLRRVIQIVEKGEGPEKA